MLDTFYFQYYNIIYVLCTIYINYFVTSAHTVLNQTSPLYSPVCLGDTVVFTCIASGTGSAVWRGDKGATCVIDNVTLSQVVDSFTINVIEINGTTVVSTATVQTVTLQLNGASISCSANLQGPHITQSINTAVEICFSIK